MPGPKDPYDAPTNLQRPTGTAAFGTMEEFLSRTRSRDLARGHRFEVEVVPPPGFQGENGERTDSSASLTSETARHLSFMVEDALLPGILLGTKAIRINNLNEQRATAIDFGGDSLTLTFLVDTSWNVQDFFGDWMRGIVNKRTREIAFPNKYYGQLNISTLNNQDQIVAKWELEDVFPRSIAPVQMSQGNTQVVRLPVTFTYKRWYVKSAPFG